MLNEFIKQTNALARELEITEAEDVRAKLTEDFNRILACTLKFISDNNVPTDTVSTIEDRIVRELLKKEQEEKIRADAAQAKSEFETAKKETDWCARGVNAGMGAAELKYIEMKTRMDDFQAESAHMNKEARMNNVGTFNSLYAEYLAAKNEYEAVGNSDAQALVEALETAKEKLAEAEAKNRECQKKLSKLPLKLSAIEYESGSGAVTRVLKSAPTDSVAEKTAEQHYIPSQTVAAGAADAPDLKRMRDEAYAELISLKNEIAQLRAETQALKQGIAEAKAAVATIEKARQAAVVSAKRTIALAEKTEKSTK